ncbi:MFS transporter [Vibrio salinus]|uniref:MFS transporter n=1 Tax=Vibrio salinus TaxID=2899784 RepID=UPI001E57F57E|nr:MFS transporter [Vibrio salinus]MCE0493146.1 MFS transporter [Vibrio salinus]
MDIKNKTKIGILTISLFTMCSVAITPSIANIADTFPDIPSFAIQMLFSLPSLTSLVSALLVGKLAINKDKRKLVLFGIALIMLGGLIPYFLNNNFYFILFCSAFVGFGTGVITTLTPTLIAENFSGDERNATFGLMTVFVSIGAILFTVLGGKLAEINWQTNYLAYLIAIPLLIIASLCLPTNYNAHVTSSFEPESDKHIKLNLKVFIIGIIGFIFLMIFTVFPTNIALFLSENHIGDASTAGLTSAILFASGLISGVLFGRISKITGHFTIMSAFLILSIGLFIVTKSHSLPFAILGSFIAGFSLSIYMARAPFVISCIVPGPTIPMAIAIYSAFTAVAAFSSPIIINGASHYFSDGSSNSAFLLASLLSFAMFFVLTLTQFEKRCLLANNATLEKDIIKETLSTNEDCLSHKKS